jgi:hypothetical protein
MEEKYFQILQEKLILHSIIKEQEDKILELQQRLQFFESSQQMIVFPNPAEVNCPIEVDRDKGRSCSECKVSTTSQWYNDSTSIGAFVCKNCYRKRKRRNKICSDNQFSAPASVKRDTERIGRQKECRLCGSCVSSCWYRDPSHPNAHRCRKCYVDANVTRSDVLQDGTVLIRQCHSCSRDKATSWYHIPV